MAWKDTGIEVTVVYFIPHKEKSVISLLWRINGCKNLKQLTPLYIWSTWWWSCVKSVREIYKQHKWHA